MTKTIFIVTCVHCVISFQTVLDAQSNSELIERGPLTGHVYSPPQRATLADGQIVTNMSILGPTYELLDPSFATRSLPAEDYVEWCLRWNKLQPYLAKQRTIPPQIIRGWITTRRGYSQGVSGGLGFGRAAAFNSSYESSRQTHEQIWRIGGYGGGPVMIYNPFVTR